MHICDGRIFPYDRLFLFCGLQFDYPIKVKVPEHQPKNVAFLNNAREAELLVLRVKTMQETCKECMSANTHMWFLNNLFLNRCNCGLWRQHTLLFVHRATSAAESPVVLHYLCSAQGKGEDCWLYNAFQRSLCIMSTY